MIEPTPFEPDIFGIQGLAVGTKINMKPHYVFRTRLLDEGKYTNLEHVRMFWDRGCLVDE
jgi:hypothetical protein